MNGIVTETARFNVDQKKYQKNYDSIFNKSKKEREGPEKKEIILPNKNYVIAWADGSFSFGLPDIGITFKKEDMAKLYEFIGQYKDFFGEVENGSD